MIRYLLSSDSGRICRAAGEKTTENEKQILLLETSQLKNLHSCPHRQMLEKSVQSVRYCKVELFEESVQGTIRVPAESGREHRELAFGFSLQPDQFLLVGEEQRLSEMIDRMAQSVTGCFHLWQFLLYLLEFLIAEDVLYLQTIEEEISDLEEQLLEHLPKQLPRKILSCRKQINRFHSYLHNHVEMLREYIIQLRELYQSQMDIEQNRIMTLLTIVTTIFMPLTLIAGWYGMNFSNMPMLGWKYGYPAVIVVSVLVIAAEIAYFRKKKML